ncbi:MAG TPA: hypothetical protein VJ863_06750 [Sphaerochaeta sp.]|nr:hypothetical protein [Sphaerochaeta sp.]
MSNRAKTMIRGKKIHAAKPGKGETLVKKITGYGIAVTKNPT